MSLCDIPSIYRRAKSVYFLCSGFPLLFRVVIDCLPSFPIPCFAINGRLVCSTYATVLFYFIQAELTCIRIMRSTEDRLTLQLVRFLDTESTINSNISEVLRKR